VALIRGPLIDVATFPTPHEAYGLCAAGLPQVKAAGLAVVFDLTAHTFYRLSPKNPEKSGEAGETGRTGQTGQTGRTGRRQQPPAGLLWSSTSPPTPFIG